LKDRVEDEGIFSSEIQSFSNFEKLEAQGSVRYPKMANDVAEIIKRLGR
jgi:hypothetical protein